MDYNPQKFDSALRAMAKHDDIEWRTGVGVTMEEYENVISILKKAFSIQVIRIMDLVKAHGYTFQNSIAEFRKDVEQDISILFSEVWFSDNKTNPNAYAEKLEQKYRELDSERRRRQLGAKSNRQYDITAETSGFSAKDWESRQLS